MLVRLRLELVVPKMFYPLFTYSYNFDNLHMLIFITNNLIICKSSFRDLARVGELGSVPVDFLRQKFKVVHIKDDVINILSINIHIQICTSLKRYSFYADI